MELPDGLELRESPIDGLGIFTTREFPADYNFGEFVGKEMPWKEFVELYGRDYRYCYRLRRIQRIICAKEKRNWITYINEKKEAPNVLLKKRACYSIRALAKGEELLLNYGKLYPKFN